jgi:hypothetical protein
MKKVIYLLIVTLLAGVYFGCSDDDKNPTKPKPTVLKVNVMGIAGADTSAVEGANVVVFNAETNQSVVRTLSDENGICSFNLSSGNYYLEVTAQGFDPSPAPNVSSVPFAVVGSTTTEQVRYLSENGITDAGYVSGYVSHSIANFLIIADGGTDVFSTYTGPDGFFVIYNLPYGTYTFRAYKSGYKLDSADPASVSLSSGAPTGSINLYVSVYEGSSMAGSLGFRAGSEEKITDMALREKGSLRVIPGLTSLAEQVGGLWRYSFENIPDGDFEIWASFKNDSNVIDPHQVYMNPTILDMSFPADNGTDKQEIFLVNCVLIQSPTNAPDSIFPVEIDTLTPEFSWISHESYSQVKEWFIEVRDMNGNRMWGGFNTDGTINHDLIGPTTFSAVYNFDGRGLPLVNGEIYQWKIWADHGAPGILSYVDKLLSSSEDLMGLFKVVLPPEEPVK